MAPAFHRLTRPLTSCLENGDGKSALPDVCKEQYNRRHSKFTASIMQGRSLQEERGGSGTERDLLENSNAALHIGLRP